MKVIIAEDDEAFSGMVERCLQGIAREIVIAKTWAEVEEYMGQRPDILWSDLRLLDSDPDQTFGKIAAVRQSDKDIVIIIMSGYVSPEMENKAKNSGIDVVALKGRDTSTRNKIMSLIMLAISNAQVRSPGSQRMPILNRAIELIINSLPKAEPT